MAAPGAQPKDRSDPGPGEPPPARPIGSWAITRSLRRVVVTGAGEYHGDGPRRGGWTRPNRRRRL